MSPAQTEIAAVEERFRLAQLNSDVNALDQLLDERMLLLSDGQPFFAKARLIEMYDRRSSEKFSSVRWNNLRIIDFGAAAVVTCTGDYASPHLNISLDFMRMWLLKDGAWKLVAGIIAQPSLS